MTVTADQIQGVPRLDVRWYLPDSEGESRDKYPIITQVVQRIHDSQAYRREDQLVYMRLYGNLPMVGLGPRTYARRAVSMQRQRLSFNVIKSCSDAYTAKMTKERPKITFLTSGGDQDMKDKAEQLEKFIEGQFYESDLYELAPLCVLDSAVIGNGIAKVFVDGEGADAKIRVERTAPWELDIDDEECSLAAPRTIYHRRYIDRLVLADMFPDFRAKIFAATETRDVADDPLESTADQILVIEAWHVRSGPNAKDGRHCIIIPNSCDLLDEEYDRDYLPFIPLRRGKPMVGWWGIGLAEELKGIQIEMNVLLQKIQRSFHLMSNAHWTVQKGMVDPRQIDNDIGTIIQHNGNAPVLAVAASVHPEIFQHLDRLYGKAYEITGISQLTAQGQIPRGFDPKSGRALRTYADIEADRFQVSYAEYQHWFLTIAKHIIDHARDIAKTNPNFAVKATSKNSMQRIRWSDINLEADEYVLKLFPTNALSSDPSARIAQVQELVNAGFIQPDDGMRLLDYPDIDAFSSLHNASYNLVMEIISRFKKGEYIGPEPFMDLTNAVKWVQLSYLRDKMGGVEPEKLRLYIDWIEQAKDILNPPEKPANAAPQGAAPPQAVAPGGMPPGPDAGSAPPMPDPNQGPPPGTPVQ